MRKKLAATGPDALLKRLHALDRLVAVTISKDGQTVSKFGARAAYPIAGARVSVQESAPHVTGGRVLALGVLALAAKKRDMHLVFEGPGWVLSVRVPGKGKPVHEFASAFNAYAAGLAVQHG